MSDESNRITSITPVEGWFALNLGEVWRYRDLLYLLAMRDISARFRQSIIGYGWAILRPLLTAAIFTLVFSVFVKVETVVPYPIFAFAGLMPWLYFSNSLTGVTSSVVGGGALLTKVYFPRLVLPLAKVAVGLVELALQFVVMFVLMALYSYMPGWEILLLPVFVVVTVVTALAFGIWLTALNVRYRDIGMAVPFLIQIWMYLCPIVYPLDVVPDRYRALYAINPMVGVVEGFRWALLGTAPPDWTMVGVSLLVMLVVLVTGIAYFRKVETTFADII
ncbi:MAG: ABC transporter permease [Phycisphaera sp. RhM]|nr:ABC transporter permease [Phycisphaera sp. RhM]